MQKVLIAEEMREVDRLTTEKYGIPSILLMENAAHAAARVITEKLGGSVEGRSILVLCGKGNNGGDGAALARILWTQGGNVSLCLTFADSDIKGDAKRNVEIYRELHKGQKVFSDPSLCLVEVGAHRMYFDDIHNFLDHDVVIDALFGTGLTTPLRNDFSLLAKIFGNVFEKDRRPLYVSIDLPSGLDSSVATPIGDNFRADITVSFTAPKPANVLPPASNFNGELVIANIGSPQELVENCSSQFYLAEKKDAQIWFEKTRFSNDSYKNKRGHALLIAGSKGYSGAAVLCGNAAMRSGAGLVTVITPESAMEAVASRVLPEVIVRSVAETESGAISENAFAEIEELWVKADAVAIGSGLSSDSDSTRKLVRKVIENRSTPLVIDADGLNALSPGTWTSVSAAQIADKDVRVPLILTPHEGEFLRLLGIADKDILKDRVKAVREFAEKHNVILVMKGERVLTAGPSGKVAVNPTGNSGLGKAGNGDTLTGIITGFVAQAAAMNVDIFETVVAAVYFAGFAGDLAEKKFGKRVMTASDVRECLAEAFKNLQT